MKELDFSQLSTIPITSIQVWNLRKSLYDNTYKTTLDSALMLLSFDEGVMLILNFKFIILGTELKMKKITWNMKNKNWNRKLLWKKKKFLYSYWS